MEMNFYVFLLIEENNTEATDTGINKAGHLSQMSYTALVITVLAVQLQLVKLV